MWSVEEVHVSHMVSIRRMSKRLSNQPTARLLRLHVSCMSWMKSTKNRGHVLIGHFIITVFLLMTQEMNPRIAPIQYLKLFQNVTSLEM